MYVNGRLDLSNMLSRTQILNVWSPPLCFNCQALSFLTFSDYGQPTAAEPSAKWGRAGDLVTGWLEVTGMPSSGDTLLVLVGAVSSLIWPEKTSV